MNNCGKCRYFVKHDAVFKTGKESMTCGNPAANCRGEELTPDRGQLCLLFESRDAISHNPN